MIFEGVVNLGHRFPSRTIADPVEREYIKPPRHSSFGSPPLRVTHEVYLFGKEEEIWDRKFARQAWEKSENCRRFKVILSKATGHKINNIVGLACGSLSRSDRNNTASQHALLITAKN
ncbi:unnamed protein product [Penicillium camemberti]|uniref:Str. FM013 n=1 Tax=Penicillium camemberti (strain FM 013) TaxID=1429867 RepID=A0A0G4PML2_PENC3|nr:unnamed protein product [Penicillium camemberti]